MPKIQKEMPNVNIYLCTNDSDFHYIESYPLAIKFSELVDYRPSLAHVKELTYNSNEQHPVEALIDDLGIDDWSVIGKPSEPLTAIYHVLTESYFPTKNLNESQIKAIERVAAIREYTLGKLEEASWIVGVECPDLFKSAMCGKQVTLIPTGVGTKLFQKMFPHAEILEL